MFSGKVRYYLLSGGSASILVKRDFSLPRDCVVLALGINNMVTYEEDLQRYSEKRCRIISVDSVGRKETEK